MEYGTFKLWLTERGCRFDTQPKQRGEGHGAVTIHREGRTAELLLVGFAPRTRPEFGSPGLRSTRPEVVRSPGT